MIFYVCGFALSDARRRRERFEPGHQPSCDREVRSHSFATGGSLDQGKETEKLMHFLSAGDSRLEVRDQFVSVSELSFNLFELAFNSFEQFNRRTVLC